MSTTTRTRRPHTRSKTGCLTCRKRRVRCDGGKPTCTRCVSAGRACEFADPSIPLRDRKATCLPGEQQPWIISQDAPPVTLMVNSPFGKSVEPFDCLGLDMTLRSRELLHYFHNSHDSADLVLSKASRNIFSSVAQHPDALRDTLLVAGLHYAWTVGDLETYKPTFLFHKVSTIQVLNRWLQNIHQPGLMTFIRHVSILCFIEASYGNVHDTEAHINGLVNAVHLLSPLDDDFGHRSEIEEELANRYLLLTYYAYQGFKARILGSDSLQNLFRQNNTAEFSTFVSQIYLWKTQNIGHLEMRLNAMKLLPFFFAALPSSTQFHSIDASPLIDCLKHVTTSTQTVREDRYKCDPSWEWIEGSDSRLLCATIGSHFSSLFHDDMFSSAHSSKYSISWSGMCAASSLYMHSVLELWNGGKAIDARLLRRFLSILSRDLSQSVSTLGLNDSTDFWLWRAFLGEYSIAKQQANNHDPLLDGLQRAFTGYVDAWKRVTGLTLWEEAHACLVTVAWPATMNYETGRGVWISAIEHTTC
ncbi:hypothetical protein FOXG_20189 [Fusarium oxysporum f. sp. lycopersici 4287]|uniref:Zn(2)-C6 fungal-type domain-containing protein n=2 Tax=Fusarium oxysporum TaxID=5507 RepID=A0A0J9VEC1_FUSO4|nr:hypothetical protein FOXG_20189 [Fusarium oxysporum f. sp. lycopersici 4287]EXK28367.1 hypothetical protein FOMG_15346 [Fusarium oxysporum f. sp. melonis 26406]KAJ9416450.1 hypothetical protein QL093DRAFT_2436519 [Fusarium oxysporum]KNB09330.1 hypothetical protein FOXG_20189 [Fusarium oxysporum f. sp. lycopersici 4287]